MIVRAVVPFALLAAALVALPAGAHAQPKPVPPRAPAPAAPTAPAQPAPAAPIPVKPAPATPVPVARDAATPSCVTSGCHSQMGQARYVHGPVAAGECTKCHTPKDEKTAYDGEKHAFRLAREERDLCYMCHEQRMDSQKVVHGPVRFGLCGACHDPHQSPYRYRLRKSPPSQLCYQCHDRDKTIEREVHGPVAEGQCVACHDPHTSPYPYRLVKQGPELCYTCHTEKRAEFTPKRFGHVPARLDCSNCHDPHTSPNPYRVQRTVPELCFGCHPDKKTQVQTARTDHEAVKIQRKCLNCHDPHFTDFPKQLQDTPMVLCFRCHDREQKATDGKMLIDMKAFVGEHKDWHGPVRQQDCAACHDPHGTDNFRILRRPYPQEFYAPFAREQYGLCFGCHEPTLALERTTTTLTGFRNGNESLHFRHVNQAKGRTCRACHETHASHRPKHIREGVPFGGWEVKTNYVKYANGGKCAPGCHVPRGYNRQQTVQNPIDYRTFTAD